MVERRGKRSPGDPGLYDESCMPGMRRIAEAIKSGGAKAALHLSHGGRVAGRPGTGEDIPVPVAPSAISADQSGHMAPRELTVDEIKEIEDKYAEAALRVKEVGFDVLGLHGAHAYLINQFLSPLSNQRQDA